MTGSTAGRVDSRANTLLACLLYPVGPAAIVLMPMIVGGLIIRPVELLAHVAASGSQNRFPAMTVERMTKAFGQPVSARTYAEAALAMLTHWPRVQIARDEAAEFEALAKADQQVETEARRKAEQIKARKAAQQAKRAAKAVNTPARAAA